jgi:uncharacterized delta-60 repeat protein
MTRLEPLEPRRLLAAADLDPSFGVGGLRTESFPGETPLVQFMTVQPDGKVIVKGVLNGSNTQHIVRYLADGSIDPSFTIDPGLSDFGFVTALRDGKIIVLVGPKQLARLNPNGSLDTTFGGGDGIADLPVAGQFGTEDIDVAPDGRIVLLGREEASGSGELRNALVVLNADGTPLASFGGGDGVISAPMQPDVNTFEDWHQVAFAPDGKIVIARDRAKFINGDEFQGTEFVGFQRYNIDGTLDNAYIDTARFSWTRGQTGGLVLDIDVASDGSIIGVGSARIDDTAGALLLKSTPTGAADSAVGSDGSRIINFGSGEFTNLQNLQVLGDGRFYAVGEVARLNRTTLVVARFNADASLDTTFGGNDEGGGVLRIFDPRMREPHVALAPDGGVFVVNDAQVTQETSPRVWHTRLLLGDPTIRLNGRGTLLVDGTTDADEVSVTLRGRDGKLVARVNGYARSFTPSKVKRIAAFTHGGNDVFTVGPNLKGVYGDGGGGDDTLNGGSGGDVLLGGGGDDLIFGNDGNDKLLGGIANDYLLGGAGKDDLFGEAGIDTLSGAGGNDRLVGGDARDFIYGGAGNDSTYYHPEDERDSIETYLG